MSHKGTSGPDLANTSTRILTDQNPDTEPTLPSEVGDASFMATATGCRHRWVWPQSQRDAWDAELLKLNPSRFDIAPPNKDSSPEAEQRAFKRIEDKLSTFTFNPRNSREFEEGITKMARATKDERATLATVIRILDEKSDPRWGDRLQRARNLVDETTVDIETLIDKWYCVGGLPAVQDLMAAERELLDTTWPRSGPLLDFIDDLRKLISLACNLRHRLGHPPWYYSEVVAQRIRLTAPQGAVVPTDLTQLSDLLEWMT